MSDIVVEPKVKAVTVYPDRARVTASGSVELATGTHHLILDGLPLALDSESLRVAGTGQARVRLLGVDVERAFYEEPPSERVQALELQLEEGEDEARAMQDEEAGLRAQLKFLDGLRQATVQYAKGLAQGSTSVEDQARLAEFLRDQDEATRKGIRELEQRERSLKRRLDRLRHELELLQAARPRERLQAVVELEALSEGAFQADVTYVVGRAGWQPLYDLRLTTGEEGRKVEMTSIAEIYQDTGQAWQAVTLAVSSARPSLNQRLPDLMPWYIDVYAPPVPREVAAAPVMRSMPAPAQAERATVAEAGRPVDYVAEAVTATVEQSETTVRYSVPGQTDIPSDGSPHKVTLDRQELKPEMDYLAVPKLADAVFRRIKVVNSGQGPLLEGPISLFTGDEFIGTSRLDYVASGGEIELLLGVEDRITIERELVQRDVDKARLRDRRQLTYGYQIELQNLTDEPVRVVVQDHIPVSRREEIKVKLEAVSPEPEERSQLNLLKWQLTLPPGGKSKVTYAYEVEHPRSLHVVGLLD